MTALAAGLLVTSSVLVAASRGAARRLTTARPVDSSALAGVVVGVAVFGAALLVALPVPALLVLALGIRGLAAFARRRGHRSRRRARTRETTTFCFVVSAELRAGRAAGDALAAAASQLPVIGPGVAAAGRACQRGADVADELAVVARAPGCERLQQVGAAWGATSSSGAQTADLLERVGAALAAEEAAERELHAHAAGPQATVVVLALLPLVAVGLAGAVGARPAAFLVHEPVGWLLSVSAAALDVAGVTWMRRIIRVALSA